MTAQALRLTWRRLLGVLAAVFVVVAMASTSAQAAPTQPAAASADFQQVSLAKGADQMGEPLGMAVLPDGSVLHTDRRGTVFDTTHDGVTTVAGKIPVYDHDEEGLQTIAIDPAFSKNHWVYVYYAPPLSTPAGDAPENGTAADWDKWSGYNVLARFTLTDGKLDMSSEKEVLRVGPTNRGICCHVGGDIDFDKYGNLYLSTGDDSNPFESDGYAPLDRRPDRNPAFDSERSAGNSNDLRGKLLRIHPEADGSYTIPKGNMFPPGTAKTRPEIYAMGFRNPYRFTVDKATGVVYLGDYGPDAGKADPNRGPGGQVEFNRITKPGFYGWPYCTGKNTVDETYNHYDFATGTSGEKFDCQNGPTNDSPLNTGIAKLPKPIPAWINYDGCSVPEFGCGSESPMGGPVYHYDPAVKANGKFPQSYDGKFFAYEFGRHWINDISMDKTGAVTNIDEFSKDWLQPNLKEPIDAEFGPDGSLYVLDYGSNWFGGSLDAALYRIDYAPGDKAPTASVSADQTSGKGPLTVKFSSDGSTDPEGDALTYAWDFDSDGKVDSTEANPTYTYTQNGQYTARLVVTDPSGRSGSAATLVTVGNTAPVVEFSAPPNGTTFDEGDQVHWQVNATDPDGTPVDCSKVQVEYLLGHAMHAHDLSQATGCSGTFTMTLAGHTYNDDLYGIFTASYTDTSPTSGVPDLTTKTQIVLQPQHKQAEFYNASQGVTVTSSGSAEGGRTVAGITSGDWMQFYPYDLTGKSTFSARVSSGGSGGTLAVHADSPDGPVVATADVPNTGGVDTYTTVSAPITDPGGTHRLYLVATGSGGGDLFTVDSFTVT
ncbi:MAG: PQQ-dependent sugar dehydrogenase [Streptosporangiales bacterium]|nr:PQQ-dependent sugar dehydrogenase [Streptosporangiales bacterium]MBO0890137.1 PQQ-dependent sugar dehydrogenase [Acidothermales bacterium]